MSVFDDLVGQVAVRTQLERAAFAARQQVERAGQDAAASSDLHGLSDALELGTESELSPGVRVAATERMLFGTLEVRLRPGGDAA